jgi:hypothetical protein
MSSRFCDEQDTAWTRPPDWSACREAASSASRLNLSSKIPTLTQSEPDETSDVHRMRAVCSFLVGELAVLSVE